MVELASLSDATLPCAAEPVAGGGAQEIEIKFRTDVVGLESALESRAFGSASRTRIENLRSIYFDTASNDLWKSGYSLRIRENKGNSRPVLTLKWKTSVAREPFRRGELEVPSVGLQPDLSLFDAQTADSLAALLGGKPLKQEFETLIKRRIVEVTCGSSRIEVAFDEGHIVGGGQRVPVTEIELELKSGVEADLCDLAIKLAQDIPLRLDFVSKSEKGHRIALLKKPTPVKAESVEFEPEAVLDGAADVILSHTLAHFVANWAPLRESNDPESVHQLRVALRRMRSGLAILRQGIPFPDFEILRTEAKRISTALGPARDCDVIRQLAEGPLSSSDCPPGGEALLTEIERRRAVAYEDARAVIDDSETTLFVLKVRRLLASRAWRNALSGADAQLLAVPATDFARETLDRLANRVLKRGKSLLDQSDEARHKLRIAFKNLRYGVDFLAGDFSHKRQYRTYVRRIADMQDLLGAHNDVVAARQFLDKLSSSLGEEGQRASGYVLGWFARGASLADGHLRRCWRRFKKTDRFWDQHA